MVAQGTNLMSKTHGECVEAQKMCILSARIPKCSRQRQGETGETAGGSTENCRVNGEAG